MDYRKKTALLITIGIILRLVYTAQTELSADESYYWTYALRLQWNYFDHPPLVGWLIRLTTANLRFHNEIFVRIGAVLAAAISTWLFFKIGTILKDEKTGWFAALLYNASLYCSIVAGANILPDSPQLVFWLAALFYLIKISRSTDNIPNANLLWCMFGLLCGLCIMCKVHGAFLWLGAALYVLLIEPKWLKNKGIYLAAAITLIIVSPIIIWNIQNNFITLKFHGSRVSVTGGGINAIRFLRNFLEQVTLNNPVNFFLIVSNLVLLLRGRLAIGKTDGKLVLFCSLPLIATVLAISIFRETFAHWSAPAYTVLLILPAVNLASKGTSEKIPGVIKAALIYMLIIGSMQLAIINYFPGTTSSEKEGLKTGSQDLTLDMYRWHETTVRFDSLYNNDVAKKIMPKDAPIIVTNWTPASNIEYYIAYKTKQEVLGIGGITDLHQYMWSNKYKRQLKRGDNAYFIVPSDSFYYRTFNKVNHLFESREQPLTITQYRGGVLCRFIYVFRMKGYKGPEL